MDNFLFVCSPCRPRGEQQGSTRRGTHTHTHAPRASEHREGPAAPPRAPGHCRRRPVGHPWPRAPAVPARDGLRLGQGSGWQCRRVSILRAPDSGRSQRKSGHPLANAAPGPFPPPPPPACGLRAPRLFSRPEGPWNDDLPKSAREEVASQRAPAGGRVWPCGSFRTHL